MANRDQNQQKNKALLHDEAVTVLTYNNDSNQICLLVALKNKDTSLVQEWYTSSFVLLNWNAMHSDKQCMAKQNVC